MSALRILGTVLAGFGILMAVFPSWFGPLTGGAEPPADTFATIERRIRGGMVLGVGMLLLARTELRPWSTAIASLIFYVVFGALIVRVLGLMFDGNSGRQWLLVAVETLIMGLAALWLWRSGTTG